MVSRKTNKRKTVNKNNTVARRKTVTKRNNQAKKHKVGFIFAIILLFFAIAGLVVGVSYLVFSYIGNNSSDSDSSQTENVETGKEQKKEAVLPDKIDFQPVVDSWVNTVGGNKSVLIYDIERDEVVGKYNSDESYSTASLYKLFVVYEGYRKVQSGEWNGDEPAGYNGHTILKCLDLAIRESNSSCAEAIWDKIGRQNLDDIIVNDFKITDSDISGLVSNPQDIMKILKIFYEHKDISDEKLIALMKDSFLNQPETTYNWRQGLPSGFKESNVYNKVGWDFNPDTMNWNIYHDAAIVETPDKNRHFIVVVMTNYVPYQKISKLGSMIEDKF